MGVRRNADPKCWEKNCRKPTLDCSIQYTKFGTKVHLSAAIVKMTKRPSVLLVDPDHDSRLLYRVFLQHHGYDVLEAMNGDDGLAGVQDGTPHVVVCELALPKRSGLELLMALRSDRETAGVPIIIATAIDLPAERRQAERAGCDAFLVKPIEPEDLLSTIRKVLR